MTDYEKFKFSILYVFPLILLLFFSSFILPASAVTACPPGLTYSEQDNRCIGNVSVCPSGFVPSSDTSACIKSIQCPISTVYDPISNQCKKDSNNVCPPGTIQSSEVGKCIATPSDCGTTAHDHMFFEYGKCTNTGGTLSTNCPPGTTASWSYGDGWVCVGTRSCPPGFFDNGFKCSQEPISSCTSNDFTLTGVTGATAACSTPYKCPDKTAFNLIDCSSARTDCPPGTEPNGARTHCVIRTGLGYPSCPEGTVDNGFGECGPVKSCPSGYSPNLTNTECITSPSCSSGSSPDIFGGCTGNLIKSCPAGMVPNLTNTECISTPSCSDGGTLKGNQCERGLSHGAHCHGNVDGFGSCWSGTILFSNLIHYHTECPSGYDIIHSGQTYAYCIDFSPNCPSGTTRTAGSLCIGPISNSCPSGLTQNGAYCTSSPASCPPAPNVRNSADLCVASFLPSTCPSGYVKISEFTCGKSETPSCPAGTVWSAERSLCVGPSSCPDGTTHTTLGVCWGQVNQQCPPGTRLNLFNVCEQDWSCNYGTEGTFNLLLPPFPGTKLEKALTATEYFFKAEEIVSDANWETLIPTPEDALGLHILPIPACILEGTSSCSIGEPFTDYVGGVYCTTNRCPQGTNFVTTFVDPHLGIPIPLPYDERYCEGNTVRTCPVGFQPYADYCVTSTCPSGTQSVNGQCITPLLTSCPSGYTVLNNVCTSDPIDHDTDLILPPNITLEANSPDFLSNGENDPSVTGIILLSGSPVGTFSDAYSFELIPQLVTVGTRTWYATDTSGFQIIYPQIITFKDTTPPVVTDPPNVTIEATATLTPKDNIQLGTATATDIFPIVSITNNAPSEFPLGETEVRWTAIDANGNSATTNTQIVTLLDTTPPVLSVPDDITLEAQSPDFLSNGENDPSATGQAIATDTVDQSPIVTFTDVHSNDPDPHILQIITRTWFAQDDSGNSVTADQIITFQDTTPPVVTDPVDVTVEATGITTPVDIGTATATDIFPISSITSDAPAEFPLGTTEVHWTATDANGNSATTNTQIVTVLDTTPPVIIVPSNITAEATGITTPVDIGTATATDIFPITSITSDAPAEFPLGTTEVHWTATDANGISSISAQTITLQDTTPPVVTDPVDVTVEATGITTPVDIGTATATDIFPITSITSDAPAEFPLGTTEVHWTATDANGNSFTTATQKVTIQDTTPPVVTDPVDVTVEATGITTPVDIGTATATDIFPITSITSDAPAEFPLGTTEVHWTATDENGNSATTNTQIVTITDTTPPVLTIPSNITLEATGTLTAVTIGTATATDIFPVTIVNNAPSSFPLGTTSVTWTATDENGNSATAIQDITIIPLQIRIDIVPENNQNNINLKSKGVTPVAIFSTSTFDATLLDVNSIVLGSGNAKESHAKLHLEDVNKDGLMDVILHFDTQKMGATPQSASLTLSGMTVGGVPVEGSDAITVKDK